MPDSRLTAPRVVELLAQVVADHPGRSSLPGAGRVRDGQPDDLVGHILVAHGFAVDELAGLAHVAASSLLPQGAADAGAWHVLDAVDRVDTVGGVPWLLILPIAVTVAASTVRAKPAEAVPFPPDC